MRKAFGCGCLGTAILLGLFALLLVVGGIGAITSGKPPALSATDKRLQADQAGRAEGADLVLYKGWKCNRDGVEGEVKNVSAVRVRGASVWATYQAGGATLESVPASLDLVPGLITPFTVKWPPGNRPAVERCALNFRGQSLERLKVYNEPSP